MVEKFIIYTDGGSRGNPGPGALGIAICDKREAVIKEYSHYLGEATNNEAEYEAVIFALKKIKALFGKIKAKNFEIEIRSDSQLLVQQLNGKYKILDKRIQLLFLEIWNLKLDFNLVSFKLIPREKNNRADRLVNEALNIRQQSIF